MQSPNLYWLIIGCETSFWLVLLLALTVRYILKRKSLSNILLLGLPALDIALFTFTAVDLGSGTVANFEHGLAAAYVGFTVAFGSVAVSWADQRFAHWITHAPAPKKAPSRGWPALRYQLLLWARCLISAAITVVLLQALIVYVNDESATQALYEWFEVVTSCVLLWLFLGPIWTLLFSSWQKERDA